MEWHSVAIKSVSETARAFWNHSKCRNLSCKHRFGGRCRRVRPVVFSGHIVAVSAVDVTFDNDDGTNDWGTAANWDINAVPTAADNAIIGGAFNVTGALTENILSLDYSSTGTSVIAGGDFNINGQITNTGSGRVEFTGNTQGLSSSNIGAVLVSGNVTPAITSSGAGTIDITGTLSTSGSGNQSQISDGTVTVNRVSNSGSADIRLTGGSLTINDGSATTISGSGTTINVSNATLKALNGFSNLNRASLIVRSGGDVNITGTLRNTTSSGNSVVTVQDGTLDAGQLSNSRATLNVSGGDVTLGALTQSRSGTSQTGGQVTVTGRITNTGFSNVTVSGGTLDVQGGVTNGPASVTVRGSGTVNVQGNGISSNASGFSSSISNVRIQNDGTLNSTRIALSRATFTQTGGTGNISGGFGIGSASATVRAASSTSMGEPRSEALGV